MESEKCLLGIYVPAISIFNFPLIKSVIAANHRRLTLLLPHLGHPASLSFPHRSEGSFVQCRHCSFCSNSVTDTIGNNIPSIQLFVVNEFHRNSLTFFGDGITVFKMSLPGSHRFRLSLSLHHQCWPWGLNHSRIRWS